MDKGTYQFFRQYFLVLDSWVRTVTLRKGSVIRAVNVFLPSSVVSSSSSGSGLNLFFSLSRSPSDSEHNSLSLVNRLIVPVPFSAMFSFELTPVFTYPDDVVFQVARGGCVVRVPWNVRIPESLDGSPLSFFWGSGFEPLYEDVAVAVSLEMDDQ